MLLNQGSLLWELHQREEARYFWDRATQIDPRTVSYLGDFTAAPPDAPAPPAIPLFWLASFRPRGEPPVVPGTD
jgi:hypothetical protein